MSITLLISQYHASSLRHREDQVTAWQLAMSRFERTHPHLSGIYRRIAIFTSSLRSSSRFRTSSALKDDVDISNYLTFIQNPGIRLIITRMRIYMNCLTTCKTKQNYTKGWTVCPISRLRNCGVFSPKLWTFSWYTTTFSNECQSIYTKYLVYFDSVQIPRFILKLNCPPDVIKICCSFVSELYRSEKIFKYEAVSPYPLSPWQV